MMRRALNAVLALWLAAVSACAIARVAWLIDDGRVTRVDVEIGAVRPVPVPGRVRSVAPTDSGGAWALTGDALIRLDGALVPMARAQLSADELASVGPMAADAADGSLWAGIGSALVRFDPAGTRTREISFDGVTLAIATTGPDAIFVASSTALVRIDASGAIVARADLTRLPGGDATAILADPLAGYVWLVRAGAVIRFDALAGLAPRETIEVPGPDAADIDVRDGTLTLVAGQRVLRFDRDAQAVLPRTFASEPFTDLAGIEIAARDPLIWFGDRAGFGAIGLVDGAVLRIAGMPRVNRMAIEPGRVALRLETDLGGVARDDADTALTLRLSIACDGNPCTPASGYASRLQLRAVGSDDLTSLFVVDATRSTFSGRVPVAPWQVAPPLRAWLTDPYGNRSGVAMVEWPITGADPRRQAAASSPPTVAITAPANNSIYTAPLTTTIRATATPGTGATIAKVEFFAGATLLGTISASPYDFSWSSVQVGTYALTARVTDSLGAVATSGVINVTVKAGAMAKPLDAWLFNDAWAAAGVAVDAAGTHNGTPAGAVTAVTSPASVPKPDTCKAASFSGGAIDVAGLAVSLAAAARTSVAFWMYWNGTDGVMPVGWVTEALVLSGGSFGFGTQNADVFGIASAGLANKWHHVVAEFTNGAVASNKLYVDGVPQPLTQRAGAPNNANAVVAATLRIGGLSGSASYRFGGQLDEVKIFNRALTATEVSAELAAANACGTVPTASLTTPSDNANFVAPASISLAATAAATATGATLTKVEFYGGTTLLTADTTSPYSYTWSSVPVGDYPLTAKATDSKGATATSTVATVHVKANVPPAVAMTAPANNSTYTAPATIGLAATAADADGTVTKVEFYQGSTRLATVTAAPYAYTWTNVAGGNYALTAKATDDKGAVTTSAVVNVKVNRPPTVSITAPANNAVFVLPASVTINASASDADGTIGKVEFFRDGGLLGSDTTSPYSYVWSSAAAGAYVLTAKATDNLGAATTSAPVSITVNVNQPPTVSITSPADGSQFVAGAVVTIGATATDADGTISKVEFSSDGVLLGSDTTVPYSLAWTTAVAGIYVLTAKATDNKGGTATSVPVNVTVVQNQPPTISLTAPFDGQLFVAPSSPPDVAMTASAADSDGAVTAVRFYKQAQGVNADPGPVLLGTVAAPPYRWTWTSVPYTDPAPGGVNVDFYLVWAEATDDRGAVTASEVAAIQVLQTAPPSPITAVITSPYSVQGVEPIVFRPPATVLLSAASSIGSAPVSKIEFVANGSVVATVTVPDASDDELKALWRSVAAGSYAVTARLTDTLGLVSTSDPITIVVAAPNPPVVTLQAPTGTQIVPLVAGTVPQSIAYAASLSDPGGTVARIEFDDNSRRLAWPASAPYSGTVSSPSRGLHVITARALDAGYRELARGAPAFALVPVAARPIVAVMTSPAPGATYGSSVTLAVDAFSPDSTIAQVDFYAGATLLGTARNAPYSIGAAFSSGVQSAYAVVTAPFTASTITAPVTFTVSGAASGTSIRLTSPADGQRFYAPAGIPLAVGLTDPGGIITRVDYYWSVSTGGGLVASSTRAPWSATWSGVGVGDYVVTAVGTYAGGKVTSAPVRFAVVANSAPSVSITSPASGQSFYAGQAISMTAGIVDPDGNVAKVEFFANGVAIGTVSNVPWAITWAPTVAGAYSLTARVTDSAGATAVTPTATTVTINPNGVPAVALVLPQDGQAFAAGATINLVAQAADGDGTVARVDFYAGEMFLGSVTSAPYTFAWTGVPAGAYTLTARATDNRGAVTSSPAANVSVAPLQLTVASPMDGASVGADFVLVQGTYQAPPNSGVTVNGKVATTDGQGRFAINNFRLAPGTNTLTVTLTAADGQSVTRTLTVTSTGAAPFQIAAEHETGFAPLTTTVRVTNRTSTPIASVTFANLGPGVLDTAGATAEAPARITYANPGVYLPSITITDAVGNSYTQTVAIVVRDRSALDATLKAIWGRYAAALASGDKASSLGFLSLNAKAKYGPVFDVLQPHLTEIVGNWSVPKTGRLSDSVGEYTIARVIDGVKRLFFVYLLRNDDGIWQIDAM